MNYLYRSRAQRTPIILSDNDLVEGSLSISCYPEGFHSLGTLTLIERGQSLVYTMGHQPHPKASGIELPSKTATISCQLIMAEHRTILIERNRCILLRAVTSMIPNEPPHNSPHKNHTHVSNPITRDECVLQYLDPVNALLYESIEIDCGGQRILAFNWQWKQSWRFSTNITVATSTSYSDDATAMYPYLVNAPLSGSVVLFIALTSALHKAMRQVSQFRRLALVMGCRIMYMITKMITRVDAACEANPFQVGKDVEVCMCPNLYIFTRFIRNETNTRARTNVRATMRAQITRLDYMVQIERKVALSIQFLCLIPIVLFAATAGMLKSGSTRCLPASIVHPKMKFFIPKA